MSKQFDPSELQRLLEEMELEKRRQNDPAAIYEDLLEEYAAEQAIKDQFIAACERFRIPFGTRIAIMHAVPSGCLISSRMHAKTDCWHWDPVSHTGRTFNAE